MRYMRTGSSMRRLSSSSMKLRSSSAAVVLVGGGGRRAGFALLGLGLVDQLDALLFEHQQELVELLGIDGVVGQVVVDLSEGQVALVLARFEQAPSGLRPTFRSMQTLLIEAGGRSPRIGAGEPSHRPRVYPNRTCRRDRRPLRGSNRRRATRCCSFRSSSTAAS